MDLQTSINLLMFGAGLALVLMSISLFNTALRGHSAQEYSSRHNEKTG